MKFTTTILVSLLIATGCMAATPPDTSIASQIPFEGQDQTWMNGSDRRDSALLTSPYYNLNVMVDANATYSFANPNDHTVVGSTAIARNNEMEVSAAVFGGDFNYN